MLVLLYRHLTTISTDFSYLGEISIVLAITLLAEPIYLV